MSDQSIGSDHRTTSVPWAIALTQYNTERLKSLNPWGLGTGSEPGQTRCVHRQDGSQKEADRC